VSEGKSIKILCIFCEKIEGVGQAREEDEDKGKDKEELFSTVPEGEETACLDSPLVGEVVLDQIAHAIENEARVRFVLLEGSTELAVGDHLGGIRVLREVAGLVAVRQHGHGHRESVDRHR